MRCPRRGRRRRGRRCRRARFGIAKAAAPESDQTGFSGTNNHEAGVDEPDLVKTDGRRIVTVAAGVLRVIDPATRRMTGKVDLPDGGGPVRRAEPAALR